MGMRCSKKAQQEMEKIFRLRQEALEILDIVVTEWKTDPLSTQCFDSRIVNKAECIISELRKVAALN